MYFVWKARAPSKFHHGHRWQHITTTGKLVTLSCYTSLSFFLANIAVGSRTQVRCRERLGFFESLVVGKKLVKYPSGEGGASRLELCLWPKESQQGELGFLLVFVGLTVDEAKTEMAQQRFMNYNQGSICPKNPDPSKMAILRTNTPLRHIGGSKDSQGEVFVKTSGDLTLQ